MIESNIYEPSPVNQKRERPSNIWKLFIDNKVIGLLIYQA